MEDVKHLGVGVMVGCSLGTMSSQTMHQVRTVTQVEAE